MRDRRSPNRPRLVARHRLGVATEPLESRRLLAATPINVASGLILAVALPVPGLAPGASTAQAATVSPSVSPAPTTSPFGPSATGPSTTLSPLMGDSETAVASASEVARPTPGRSDRISSYVEAPEIEMIRPLRSPDEAEEVVPGPEIQSELPAPAPPKAPEVVPAEPAAPAPARPFVPAPAPAPAPKAPAVEAAEPLAFETWDAAVEAVATDEPEATPAPPVRRAEVSLAAGALLAAWAGGKYGARVAGRSRRRPIAIAATLEAGPGSGDGR